MLSEQHWATVWQIRSINIVRWSLPSSPKQRWSCVIGCYESCMNIFWHLTVVPPSCVSWKPRLHENCWHLTVVPPSCVSWMPMRAACTLLTFDGGAAKLRFINAYESCMNIADIWRWCRQVAFHQCLWELHEYCWHLTMVPPSCVSWMPMKAAWILLTFDDGAAKLRFINAYESCMNIADIWRWCHQVAFHECLWELHEHCWHLTMVPPSCVSWMPMRAAWTLLTFDGGATKLRFMNAYESCMNIADLWRWCHQFAFHESLGSSR